MNLLNPLFLLPWAVLLFFAVRFVVSRYFQAGSRTNLVTASVVGAFVVGALFPNFRLWDGGTAAAPVAASPTPTAAPAPVVEHPYEGDPNADKAPPVTWDAKRGAFVQLGRPLQTARLWKFEETIEGFTGSPHTAVGLAPGGGLTVINGEPGSFFRTPTQLMLDGHQNTVVVVRLTRIKAGSSWKPIVYYSVPHRPEIATVYEQVYRGKNPRVGQTVTLVFDMTKPGGAANDWTRSEINQIRMQTDEVPGGAFIIREFAVVQRLFR